MILKGSQRAGAADLAAHLMNDRDNDHVSLYELRGFVASDLHGALSETHAISKGTRCTQYLFSLSLNPPIGKDVTEPQFIEAIERAEAKLGLSNQPRAIIFHEKEGRRHAHVAWSRIDGVEMKAINLPHFKTKLNTLAHELYLEHGWDLPEGMQIGGGKSPYNFTLAEWQQAKRSGLDPREIKQAIQQVWAQSDSAKAFKHGLEDKGYMLARGDRRGFVVLDCDKNVYALSRALGIKAKEVKARLGDPADQLSVSEAESLIDRKISQQLRGFIKAFKDKQAAAWQPLNAERQALKDQHRADRAALSAFHAKRQKDELKDRLVLRTGLGGLWDRFTGRASEIRKANELAAWQSAKRDQSERDNLVFDQMVERCKLQSKVHALRQSQQAERSVMARMIGDAYRAKSLGITRPTDEARTMTRKRAAERFNIGADPPDHADAEKVRPPKGPDLSR